jgi:hypothetical protein
MADETRPEQPDRPAIGGDLLVPAMGVAFAVYFLVDVADLAWEARATATVIAIVLLALIAIQLVRVGMKLAAGVGTPGIGPLIEPRRLLPDRLMILGVTGVFIVALPWLGLTLGLFVLVSAMMRLLHAGSWTKTVITAAAVSIAAYLLFIALLDSRMPRGPFEKLVALIF